MSLGQFCGAAYLLHGCQLINRLHREGWQVRAAVVCLS